METARRLSFAARFVSGYLHAEPAAVNNGPLTQAIPGRSSAWRLTRELRTFRLRVTEQE
jgi:transglutaminase-like putative cysteine protease